MRKISICREDGKGRKRYLTCVVRREEREEVSSERKRYV